MENNKFWECQFLVLVNYSMNKTNSFADLIPRRAIKVFVAWWKKMLYRPKFVVLCTPMFFFLPAVQRESWQKRKIVFWITMTFLYTFWFSISPSRFNWTMKILEVLGMRMSLTEPCYDINFRSTCIGDSYDMIQSNIHVVIYFKCHQANHRTFAP